jgi:hypothetical protein
MKYKVTYLLEKQGYNVENQFYYFENEVNQEFSTREEAENFILENNLGIETPIEEVTEEIQDPKDYTFRLLNTDNLESIKYLDYNIIAKHENLTKETIYNQDNLPISNKYLGKDEQNNDVIFIEEIISYETVNNIITKRFTSIKWYLQNNEVGYEIIDNTGKIFIYE